MQRTKLNGARPSTLTALFLAVTMSVACGEGDDGDNNGSANGSTNGATNGSTNGGTNGGTNGAPNNGGGGMIMQASGTYNGTAFTVECLEDQELTSGDVLGFVQCPGTQVQIQCRQGETGFAGVEGELFVQIQAYDTEDNYTIALGDTLGQALNTMNSPNIGEHMVTFERFEVDSSVKGSFSATWTDDGSPAYGEVSGTFDGTCD